MLKSEWLNSEKVEDWTVLRVYFALDNLHGHSLFPSLQGSHLVFFIDAFTLPSGPSFKIPLLLLYLLFLYSV